MPKIATVAELVDQLGSVIAFPDPLEELRARGFTIAPDVQARLDAAAPPARLDQASRQQLATLASRLGPVRATISDAARPRLQPLAASLGYDVTIGVRLCVLNETLAALSEGMRYPREVPVDGLDRRWLDDLSADIPPDVAIGPVRLTDPATVSAVDGTDHLLFAQRFSLEFRRTFSVGPGAPRQVTVSSLDGTARLGVVVNPVVVTDIISLGIDFETSYPPPKVDQLVLTIAPESPVQPKNPTALSDFAGKLDFWLRSALRHNIGSVIYSMSPVISLPLGRPTDFTIRGIGVRTFTSPDGDVIVAAVRFDTPGQPDPEPGDPATLANPFPAGEPSQLNTYVRFTETALRKVVKAAQRSGALEAIARESDDNLRVDGADVQLAPNDIKIILDVRKVDACPVLVGSIDVSARATVTLSLSVFDGKAYVTGSTNIDVDNTDVAVCVITNLLLFAFFVATDNLVGVIFELIRIVPPLFASGDGGGSFFEIFPAIFDVLNPVPGTEVVAEAETVQALVSEDRVEALGTLSLRPDNINTYVYAQFMRSASQLLPIPGAGQLGQPPTPIKDAVVQLMDQDVPPPAGDDAQPPVYSHTTTSSTPPGDPTTTTTTTTTVSFVAPTADQELARHRTDDQGRVQFVLTPSRLQNSAGDVVTTVDTQITRGNAVGETTTRVTRRALTENLPDVYFRVTPPDGSAFDTRLFDNGLVINLRSRRIGTAAAPLVFLTRKQGPVVFGRRMIARLLAWVGRPRTKQQQKADESEHAP